MRLAQTLAEGLTDPKARAHSRKRVVNRTAGMAPGAAGPLPLEATFDAFHVEDPRKAPAAEAKLKEELLEAENIQLFPGHVKYSHFQSGTRPHGNGVSFMHNFE
jgi:hypothetical protein